MDVKIKGLEKIASRDGYVRDELTPGDIVSDIYSISRKIQIDVVEKQDEMIIDAIREIGGTTYEHITVDRHKVLAALEKTVKNRVIRQPYRDTSLFKCPVCNRLVTTGQPDGRPFFPMNYCGGCGQALDWDGLTDRGVMEEEDDS